MSFAVRAGVMAAMCVNRREFLAIAAGAAGQVLLSPQARTLRIGVIAGGLAPSVLRRTLDGVTLGVEEAQRTAALFGIGVEIRVMEVADVDGAEHAARSLLAAGSPALVTCLAAEATARVASAHRHGAVVHIDANIGATAGGGNTQLFRIAAVDPVRHVWLPTLERFGAAQLNDRFRARFPEGPGMDDAAWAGWFAVKVLVESALRSRSVMAGALRVQLRAGRFDGHKGVPLTFGADGRLVQPVYDAEAPSRQPRPARTPARRVLVRAAGFVIPLLAAGLFAPLPAAGAQAAPATELLWVSNEESRDVIVIRASDGARVARIPLGERPRGIHASPDGRRIYVALSDEHPHAESGRDAVAVIDVKSRRVVARHGVGSDPEQFGISPDGRRLYAANEDAGTASVIDLATRRVLATVVVGIEPEGVAVSPDGRWVYVTAETSNSVSVLDARTNVIVANLLVDVRPRGVAFAPDGRRAYVSAEIGGSVSPIDVTKHEVLAPIALEGGAGKPVGVAVSRDGRHVYVANGATHHVVVVDPAARRVVARIPVGRRPWGVTLSPDGRRLYVANGLTNDVSVIETRTHRVVATVKAGARPWGIAVTK